MDKITVLANFVMLFASIFMVMAGTTTSQKKFLEVQNLMLILQSLGYGMLQGWTGLIMAVISIGRNALNMTGKMRSWTKYILVVITVVISFTTGMKRFIDWLPLLGGCGFTLFIDLKNQVWFKIMIIITTGCYFVYDFALHGYTAFVFDALTMLTNLFAMFKIMKMDKKIA